MSEKPVSDASKTRPESKPWDGHTPTPWARQGLRLIAPGRGVIAHFPTPKTDGTFEVSQNIEFAHRAVNSFDSLLEACKEMREAAAAMMRAINRCEAGSIGILEEELRAARVENGFGVRAQQAIEQAEQSQ